MIVVRTTMLMVMIMSVGDVVVVPGVGGPASFTVEAVAVISSNLF